MRMVRDHDVFKTLRGAESDTQLLAAARDREQSPNEAPNDRPTEDRPTRPPQDHEP
jgi:hypothetical protein